jgi:hypothetical protein
MRHRIEARERDQAEKLSVEIRRELASVKAQGEEAVRQKLSALEAANAALQETMNERIEVAER